VKTRTWRVPGRSTPIMLYIKAAWLLQAHDDTRVSIHCRSSRFQARHRNAPPRWHPRERTLRGKVYSLRGGVQCARGGSSGVGARVQASNRPCFSGRARRPSGAGVIASGCARRYRVGVVPSTLRKAATKELAVL
jgi:hypothetical protein